MKPRNPDQRDKVRARVLSETPGWYNPWLHLASTSGIGMAVLVISVLNLHEVRPMEWLTVPAVLLFSNWFEWLVHKYVLHRRLWPFGVIYQKHTPEHHAIYMNGDMEIRSVREFRLVLIPAAGILGIVLAATPMALLFARLLSPNCGWLYLVTTGLTTTFYELSHLSYHLGADTFIGRRWLVRVLREHHERHHDPSLMREWNFNVTFPLFDWIMGTIAPRKR